MSEAAFEISMTYEPYSLDPDYIEANRAFMHSLDLEGVAVLLDLACGIGTLSKLLLEKRPDLEVIGLDLSDEGLRVARPGFPEGASVGLLCGSADRLPLRSAFADMVTMGHSIHMLPDPGRLLGEIRRVLRPGGTFVFNTSFYANTFVDGTESIYHDWTMNAIQYIREKDRELRAQAKPGIKRQRGTAAAAFSTAWPSAAEWLERLGRHGFEARADIRTVRLTQRSFESIAAYGGFSKVIMSGYPVEEACEALMNVTGKTFADHGITEVPRYWLEVTALKRRDSGGGQGKP